VLVEEGGILGRGSKQEQQDADDCAADYEQVTQEARHFIRP
jgi:hypothetical protein